MEFPTNVTEFRKELQPENINRVIQRVLIGYEVLSGLKQLPDLAIQFPKQLSYSALKETIELDTESKKIYEELKNKTKYKYKTIFLKLKTTYNSNFEYSQKQFGKLTDKQDGDFRDMDIRIRELVYEQHPTNILPEKYSHQNTKQILPIDIMSPSYLCKNLEEILTKS